MSLGNRTERPRSDSLAPASRRRAKAPQLPRASRPCRCEVVSCCDVLKLTGTLTADERSSVASNTSGIAAEVRVDRGDLVRKGDVLVQIDATDAREQAGRRPGDARRVEGASGPRRRHEQVQSLRRAGGEACQGVGRPGRLELSPLEGPLRQEGHFDRGVRANRRPSTNRRCSAIVRRCSRSNRRIRCAGPPRSSWRFSAKAVDDTTIRAPFCRLRGRETRGRRRADFLGNAGHEGRHLGADRPVAAVADGAAAGHRTDSAGADRAVPRR